MPKRKKIIRFVIRYTLVYLALTLAVYIFQSHLIFMPYAEIMATPDSDYEEVSIQVGSHTTNAWFIPAPDEPRGTVLFSHGNAGNIGHRIETITLFHEMGFNTLIYDYGGFGKSTGKPSEQRCYADIRAMWDYLTKVRNIPPEKIVLAGRSLGGGATSQLATEVTPAAVILESTFTSVVNAAPRIYNIFPIRLLAKHRFDTINKIENITSPILHIHSPDDAIIPYTHGQQLFQASTEPKRFLEIHGSHNFGYVSSREIYMKGISDFLADHGFPHIAEANE